ncbi:hypothetical protein AOLI_G00318330 [Acnodon oligacanthus]
MYDVKGVILPAVHRIKTGLGADRERPTYKFIAMVATAYEDSMTMVLPTKCEEAPRGLILRGLRGYWASWMETVGAIGSMSTPSEG